MGKKNLYKVEFKDRLNDYGCVVVKAGDAAAAWKKAVKQTGGKQIFVSPYAATICIRITEIRAQEAKT